MATTRAPKIGTALPSEAALPDLTGWPAHPSERRDFYHRVRVFPPDVARWRKRLVRHVLDHPDRFPAAALERFLLLPGPRPL